MQFGAEDADARQIAVPFGEIEAIADDVVVGNREADEVGRDFGLAAVLFVEQHAGVQRGGLLGAQDARDFREGVAGVQYVVYEQDVLLRQVEADLVNDFRLGDGFILLLIRRDADAVEADVGVELAQQVGGKHDGAVGDADGGDFLDAHFAVKGGDLAPEFDNAAADVLRTDKDKRHVLIHGTDGLGGRWRRDAFS